MRRELYNILEHEDETFLSKAYNVLMLLTILISLIPLMTKASLPILTIMDHSTAIIFGIDYFLRLFTADLKLRRGKWSFLIYPFTVLAIVDLVSILPNFLMFNSSFKLLKIIRMGRMLRVFRVIRHSRNIEIIRNVIREQKEALLVVAGLALSYTIITALLIYNVEPDSTFGTFFEAVYWVSMSLTTVGYSDIIATTVLGKLITMISSVLGIAIIALPAGIVTAGYMTEITKKD